MKYPQVHMGVRLAAALMVAVCSLGLSSGAAAQNKFGSTGFGETGAPDEDPTTLPMVDGGLGNGGWWVADDDKPSEMAPLGASSQPTVTLVGYAYHLDLAILSSTGSGFGIVETLPGGLQRRSFHGNVQVIVDLTMVGDGLVELELHLPPSYYGAQAAVSTGGVWTPPFNLTGEAVLPVPMSVILPQADPVLFLAINPIGDRYGMELSTTPGRLHVMQSLDV